MIKSKHKSSPHIYQFNREPKLLYRDFTRSNLIKGAMSFALRQDNATLIPNSAP